MYHTALHLRHILKSLNKNQNLKSSLHRFAPSNQVKNQHRRKTDRMKARYKSPSGTGVIELPDDATVSILLDELRSKSGIDNFSIKYGPPMDMRTLGPSQFQENARSLGLHGETLTIVPDESRPLTPPISQEQPRDTGRHTTTSQDEGPEDITIPWPQREGTLCKPS